MSYRILVPLDGTQFALRALPPAVELALARGAELRVIHAVSSELEKARTDAYLEMKTRDLSKDLSIVTEAFVGQPVDVLLEASEWVDLIVMASHGRSGLERFFMGSVTESTLRESHCPLLVIESKPFSLKDTQRVMVPLDGSEISLRALPHACRLCAESGATLVLCRVEDSPGIDLADVPTVEEQNRQLEQEYRNAMEESIDSSIAIECLHNFGSVAPTLSRIIEQHKIDVLVMSTHGLGGVQRLVLGSVAEAMIRTVDIPMLLIPPKVLELAFVPKLGQVVVKLPRVEIA